MLILKRERLKQKISATQLAEKIGISRAAITHIEADRARPTLWIMLRIAEGLDLKLDEIIEAARRSKKH